VPDLPGHLPHCEMGTRFPGPGRRNVLICAGYADGEDRCTVMVDMRVIKPGRSQTIHAARKISSSSFAVCATISIDAHDRHPSFHRRAQNMIERCLQVRKAGRWFQQPQPIRRSGALGRIPRMTNSCLA
jgi:hypothetical protein